MRLAVAFRAFWYALIDAAMAQRIAAALETRELPEQQAAPSPPAVAPPQPVKRPARSEAVSLLAALQREARFVDLVQESLDAYDDAQVGAAARDVLRDCRTVLDRMFHLQPLIAEEEGAEIQVPADFDTGRIRLSGNVAGQPPFAGRLVHHGWIASRCEIPQWSGSEAAAAVIAPAEVEL